MVDNFQLMTIISKAITTCSIDSSANALNVSSEQANCVAKTVITALEEAGLAIEPIVKSRTSAGRAVD
jgi:hypothetical protein